MNSIKFKMTCALTLGLAILALRAGETKSPAVSVNTTNTFTVSGMHCDGCAQGITMELRRTPGVASASVNFSNKLAVVAYDTNRVSSERLMAVVAEAGYAAKPASPAKP